MCAKCTFWIFWLGAYAKKRHKAHQRTGFHHARLSHAFSHKNTSRQLISWEVCSCFKKGCWEILWPIALAWGILAALLQIQMVPVPRLLKVWSHPNSMRFYWRGASQPSIKLDVLKRVAQQSEAEQVTTCHNTSPVTVKVTKWLICKHGWRTGRWNGPRWGPPSQSQLSKQPFHFWQSVSSPSTLWGAMLWPTTSKAPLPDSQYQKTETTRPMLALIWKLSYPPLLYVQNGLILLQLLRNMQNLWLALVCSCRQHEKTRINCGFWNKYTSTFLMNVPYRHWRRDLPVWSSSIGNLRLANFIFHGSSEVALRVYKNWNAQFGSNSDMAKVIYDP